MMIITIGFIPEKVAGKIIDTVGGVIIRNDCETHLCDVQFDGYAHTIKIYDFGDLRIKNTSTRVSTRLYWNEYGSLHVNNAPTCNEK